MKFVKIALFSLPFALLACGDSTSGDDSPYGTLRYERHVPEGEDGGICYVYEKDSLFTLVFKENYGMIGTITITSQAEVGSRIKMHDEVDIVGNFSSNVYADFCNEEKAAYEAMGGTVTCTKSKITADADLGESDPQKIEKTRSQAVSKLSESCDTFLEEFEQQMKEAQED